MHHHALVLEFAVSYLLIMALPGTNFLVVIDAAASGSRRATLAAAAGVGFGAAALSLAAGSGVLILSADPRLATFGKLLLAAILVVIGLRALRRACFVGQCGKPATGPIGRGSFFEGLLTAVTNPVTGAFFVSSSVRAGQGGADVSAALMPAVVFVLATSWFGTVGLAFTSRRIREAHASWRRECDLLLGALLVGFGAWAAARLVAA